MRDVTTEQLEEALKIEDNRNIMRKVTSRYAALLHPDDLYTCSLYALWRTLQCHDPSYNQKFTTSLFRFCEWECKRELRKNSTKVLSMTVPLEQASQSDVGEESFPTVDDEWIREAVDQLNDEDREIVQFYFLESRSLREVSAKFGWSKQMARKRKNEAMKNLKERLMAQEG